MERGERVKKLLGVVGRARGSARDRTRTSGSDHERNSPTGKDIRYVGLVTFYDDANASLVAVYGDADVESGSPDCRPLYGGTRVAARVWFDTDPIDADLSVSPDRDRRAPERAGPYRGWHASRERRLPHPDYDPNAVLPSRPRGRQAQHARSRTEASAHFRRKASSADLPKHASMTAVGYGFRQLPASASWKNEGVRIRMVATPRIMGIVGDFAIPISHDAKGKGGGCLATPGGRSSSRAAESNDSSLAFVVRYEHQLRRERNANRLDIGVTTRLRRTQFASAVVVRMAREGPPPGGSSRFSRRPRRGRSRPRGAARPRDTTSARAGPRTPSRSRAPHPARGTSGTRRDAPSGRSARASATAAGTGRS